MRQSSPPSLRSAFPGARGGLSFRRGSSASGLAGFAGLWVGILLLLAFPVAARAATYVIPADELLIGKADCIVRGQVVDVAPSMDPEGGIHTDVTIAVVRVLKGAPGQATIVVRQPGGQVGDRSEVYPGIGSFSAGDEILVMLDAPSSRASNASVVYRVTDFALGNFRVLKTADGSEFLRREGLREAFVLSASSGATSADTTDPDRDAAAFERYIRAEVQGVTAAVDYRLEPQQASADRTAAFVFLGAPPARRSEFDSNTTITYTDNASGDNGTVCGGDHCHGAVEAGMLKWNTTPGTRILLRYGGPDSSIGSKCLSDLVDQVQFNDPCDEISNLSFCSGTLALGGFSSSSQSGGSPACPAKNNPAFGKIRVAKILINNGVGACFDSCDYTEMVAHETGHTLGAGHTSSSGSLMQASLNHGFCGAPRADDLAFAQCAYPCPGAPRITSITPKIVDGALRAVVVGKKFRANSRVEIDSGGGFVSAPTTKYVLSTKLSARNLDALWPAGMPVSVRVVNPNGCVSNPTSVTR